MTEPRDEGLDPAGDKVTAAAIDHEALDWVLRMAEPDADWDAFTMWLEGDPLRAERYDAAAVGMIDVQEMIAHAPAVEAAVVLTAGDHPDRGRVRRWWGVAVAAALIGALGLGVWNEMPRPYDVATAPGQQRTVALGEGSNVVLAGGTTIRLDRNDRRVASLQRGEALFHVRHDAAHPFRVAVGELRLVDLGTVFDVKAADAGIRVAVAEGAVMVDPDGAAMRLDPGQAAVVEGDAIERRSVDPANVGSWQQGRLAYDEAPLAEVAADLSRQLGRRVRVAPGIATRTFRGTLELQSVRHRPALLGDLLGVAVRQDDEGWMLVPAP